jgi:hypothetical protein
VSIFLFGNPDSLLLFNEMNVMRGRGTERAREKDRKREREREGGEIWSTFSSYAWSVCIIQHY